MSRVTDMRYAPAIYHCPEGRCTGTNLLYRVDGQQRSSRVPWVVNSTAEATAHVERVLARTEPAKPSLGDWISNSTLGGVTVHEVAPGTVVGVGADGKPLVVQENCAIRGHDSLFVTPKTAEKLRLQSRSNSPDLKT